MAGTTHQTTRNKTFDLLRIFLALLVLLSHAPEFTDGNRSRELFTRLTGNGPVSFGELGVDGFFLLSGYLITQSWSLDPRLFDFLQKRVLRIFPGWLCAVILSTLVAGLAAPAVPDFFFQLGHHILFYGRLTLLLGAPFTPAVYPHVLYHSPDGPLWTIPYEFKCYLLVALLGLMGLVRRRWLFLTAACGAMIVFATPSLQARLSWQSFHYVVGEPVAVFRFIAVYLVGSSFYLFKDRIRFRPPIACAALLLMLACRFHRAWWEPGIALFGGYLLFYLGQIQYRCPEFLRRLPDISYGLYLYGGLVELLWVNSLHTSPWITFFVSSVAAAGLGWLSWDLVERPMLRLKRRPTSRLPPP